MRALPVTAAFLLVTATLFVAGCTAPPSAAPASTPPAATAAPSSAPPAATAASTPGTASGVTVKILKDAILAAGDPAKSWSQPELHIKAGTTVTWENDDTVPHDVTFVSGPEKPNSGGPGNIEPGKSWSHTFTAPGTYIYECSIHVTLMNKPGVGPEVVVE